MKDNIKVTFLMTAYNTEKYVEAAVRSILNQSEQAINLYIRDNGSTDRTGEILRQLALEDSRITLIRNEKNGVTEKGITNEKLEWWIPDNAEVGEYFSIVDSDDTIDAKFVEILYKKAKETNADITFAGNNFVRGGKITGTRLPEDKFYDNLSEVGNEFPIIYNVFRTWWGKLYKCDFFIDNYEFMFKPHGPIWWSVDTILMGQMLKCSGPLEGVAKPLYNMTIRGDSTYKSRKVDRGRIFEAYALYDNNIELLKQWGIDTKENISFVEDIHWAYLSECFEGLVNSKEMTPGDKLKWLEDILRDDIVRLYGRKKFEVLFFQMKPIIESIMAEIDMSDKYKHFLERLCAFVNIISDNAEYDLADVVLIGALQDTHNECCFGDPFINLKLPNRTIGIQRVVESHFQLRKWWHLYPGELIEFVKKSDLTPEVKELESEMFALWKANRFDEACEVSFRIIEMCPMCLSAILCRIYYWKLHDEFEERRLLWNTVINIWPIEWVYEIRKNFVSE